MKMLDAASDVTRAILLDPDADDLRLILADAMEDAGDGARAAFVRAGVSLHQCKSPPCYKKTEKTCRRCRWCKAWKRVVRTGWNVGVKTMIPDPGADYSDTSDLPEFGYYRGLPEVWSVTDVPTFERDAAAVFATHPIRRVVLRCGVANPIWNHQASPTHQQDPDDCPDELFALLTGEPDGPKRKYYDSTEAARADLERCLAIRGRRLAGLPDLGSAR